MFKLFMLPTEYMKFATVSSSLISAISVFLIFKSFGRGVNSGADYTVILQYCFKDFVQKTI